MSGGALFTLIFIGCFVLALITKPLWDNVPDYKPVNQQPKPQRTNNEIRLYYLERINTPLKELQNCGTVEDAKSHYEELKQELTNYYNKGFCLNEEYNTLDKALKLANHEFKLKLLDIAQSNIKEIGNNSFELNEEQREKKEKEYKIFNENLSKVCALNNKGIALEKDGNIEGAITTYEEGILIPYKAHHSYDRLLVLYRKKKDYENEKRVCLLAIERFNNKKYKDRLVAIESKINKASKP